MEQIIQFVRAVVVEQGYPFILPVRYFAVTAQFDEKELRAKAARDKSKRIWKWLLLGVVFVIGGSILGAVLISNNLLFRTLPMSPQLREQQRCQLTQLAVDDVWPVDASNPATGDAVMLFSLRNSGSINLNEEEWKAISVTGGVENKDLFSSTTLINGFGTAVGQCYVNITGEFDAQMTRKVACIGFGGESNWENNDVYTITVQPACGTGGQNSWVYYET